MPAAERLTISGSSTVQPLVAEIARRFEERHPELRIDVQGGGSSRGVVDVRSGRAHIGMLSRAPTAEERDLKGTIIARDGIACIVHRNNPLTGLTSVEVADLFTGRTASWQALTGIDRSVVIVSKAEGRATLELFLAHFRLKADQIRAQVVIGDNAQGIKTVAANPDGIGYVSIGAAETDIAAGVAIRLVPLDGVTPTSAAVADATWPLARPLTLVTTGSPSATVQAFLTYAASSAVDDLIIDLAFVPPPR